VIKYSDFLAKDVTISVSCSNIVIKKDIFEREGGLLRSSTPETFHMDTFDMLLRFGVLGPCVIVKKPVTVGYRSHVGNVKKLWSCINETTSLFLD